MGGVIVDGGNYNWANGKFPQIDGPSEGYHGLNLHEAFGPAAFIVKCRVDGLRDLGCCPSPFDSYLMMIGLETLSLRVKHQVESAWKLAEYCRSHPKVERVSFVGFDTHPSHENARKYYRYGSSAVFTGPFHTPGSPWMPMPMAISFSPRVKLAWPAPWQRLVWLNCWVVVQCRCASRRKSVWNITWV